MSVTPLSVFVSGVLSMSVTPLSVFVSGVLSMSVTPLSVFVMMDVESYFGLPYVNCLHFVECNCHFSDDDVSLLMSTCKICSSISHLCKLWGYLKLSLPSGRSIMKSMKRTGRGASLGIPLVTSDHSTIC